MSAERARGRKESGTTLRPIRRSGMRSKFDLDAASAPVSGERERPELAAMSRIGDLVASATTARAVFDELVAMVNAFVPLRAFAIVPCDARVRPVVWTARRSERAVAEAEAVASLDALANGDARHQPLEHLPWTTLPVVASDGVLLGVVAAAPVSGRLDAHGEKLLAFVARQVRGLIGGIGRLDGAAVLAFARAERARAAAEQIARTQRLVSEVTALLFDSLDYASTLRETAHLLVNEAASGCVIDIDVSDASRRIIEAPSCAGVEMTSVLDELVEAIIENDAPLATNAQDPLAKRFAGELGADWLVSVPLRNRRQVFGALSLFGRDAEHPPFDPRKLEELGRRVASAIENGQLYESAVEGSRMRDQVLSTVSHDLKNPLGVILLSSARMLEEMPETDRRQQGRKQVEAIQRCAKRMRKLVADLLDVAALDNGVLTMTPRACDLCVMVDDALEAVDPLANAAGLTLLNRIQRDLPAAWADGDRILQVLSNVVGNAIKFTPRGGTIRVHARPHERCVALCVEDTGCGIATDELAHIFDRFWQSPATASLGSGLGLSICKSIIELSGGRMWADSEIGVGTKIWFTLPLAHEPPPASAADRARSRIFTGQRER